MRAGNLLPAGEECGANPVLTRRELAEGHTVAHHSFRHPLLDHMRPDAAMAEIDHGMAAVDTALFGVPSASPHTPFFRFPGFASTPVLLDRLRERGIAVFGADLWASDWNRMAPHQELRLVMERLDANRGGIVLLHDTKRQTAAMLPALLHNLKANGYRVVHVVADDGKRPQSDHALSTKN
jgi:peptidoglycan-N-acetylglucosamine deacetylase